MPFNTFKHLSERVEVMLRKTMETKGPIENKTYDGKAKSSEI